MRDSVQFIIELTESCNFNCKYCYLAQASGRKNSTRKMSLHTGLDIMKFLFHDVYRGQEPIIFVDFLDGEPLLNFDVLREMVLIGTEYEQQVGQKVFVFRFTTNGSLLTESIVQFTKEHGVYFNISVDGIPESHDANRVYQNGMGTSADVHGKLHLVSGLKHVGVVSTYSPNTYHLMDDGTNYLMNKGIRHIEINFSMGYGKYEDIEELMCIFNRNIDRYLSNYARGDFSHTYVILDNVLRRLFSRHIGTSQCILPFKITFDGRILSCDRIPAEMNKVITNIYSGKFDLAARRKDHLCVDTKPERCRSCVYREICFTCYMYVSDDKAEKYEGQPVYCHIMQAIIKKAQSFYMQHRNNINVAAQFDMQLRNNILSNKYEIIDV